MKQLNKNFIFDIKTLKDKMKKPILITQNINGVKLALPFELYEIIVNTKDNSYKQKALCSYSIDKNWNVKEMDHYEWKYKE